MQQLRILMEWINIPAFILYTLVIAEIRRMAFTCTLVQEYDCLHLRDKMVNTVSIAAALPGDCGNGSCRSWSKLKPSPLLNALINYTSRWEHKVGFHFLCPPINLPQVGHMPRLHHGSLLA